MTKNIRSFPEIHCRRAAPKGRPDVYKIYWEFASRRHEIFERRLTGAPWPWTQDRIFKSYKFCNVFRAADRVSQYMIRDVAYAQEDGSSADRLFQIVAFRTFSNIRTWQDLRVILGGAPRLEHLSSGDFERALERIKAARGGLYTGAFILCATKAFGFHAKHLNHVALFKHMFNEGRLAESLLEARSLEDIVKKLEGFPLMGPFMSYQTAIDLNYSALINFGENDYTQAGPGAVRGIKKSFVSLGDYSLKDIILWMTEQQDIEFERLGLKFNGLFGRKLHAIDCQGLFCELDKYCREAVPELASNRSRIKARFLASPEPLPLFFPPKWKLKTTTEDIIVSGLSVEDQQLIINSNHHPNCFPSTIPNVG